jgi:hypothetical protein
VRAARGLQISTIGRSWDFVTFYVLPHVFFNRLERMEFSCVVMKWSCIISFISAYWTKQTSSHQRPTSIPPILSFVVRRQRSDRRHKLATPRTDLINGRYTSLVIQRILEGLIIPIRDDGVHLRCPARAPSLHVATSSPMHRLWRSVRSSILQHRHVFRPVSFLSDLHLLSFSHCVKSTT